MAKCRGSRRSSLKSCLLKNVEIEKSKHCCLKNVFLMLELIPVVFPVAYLPKNSHIKFCGKRSCSKKVMVKKPKLIYFWPVLYVLTRTRLYKTQVIYLLGNYSSPANPASHSESSFSAKT